MTAARIRVARRQTTRHSVSSTVLARRTVRWLPQLPRLPDSFPGALDCPRRPHNIQNDSHKGRCLLQAQKYDNPCPKPRRPCGNQPLLGPCSTLRHPRHVAQRLFFWFLVCWFFALLVFGFSVVFLV